MRAEALHALIRQHGGIASIHTLQVRNKRTGIREWANQVRCADGWKRTLSETEERKMNQAEPGSLSIAAVPKGGILPPNTPQPPTEGE